MKQAKYYLVISLVLLSLFSNKLFAGFELTTPDITVKVTTSDGHSVENANFRINVTFQRMVYKFLGHPWEKSGLVWRSEYISYDEQLTDTEGEIYIPSNSLNDNWPHHKSPSLSIEFGTVSTTCPHKPLLVNSRVPGRDDNYPHCGFLFTDEDHGAIPSSLKCRIDLTKKQLLNQIKKLEEDC